MWPQLSTFLLNISDDLFSFFLVQVSGNGNSYYDKIFTPTAELVNESKAPEFCINYAKAIVKFSCLVLLD